MQWYWLCTGLAAICKTGIENITWAVKALGVVRVGSIMKNSHVMCILSCNTGSLCSVLRTEEKKWHMSPDHGFLRRDAVKTQ